MVDPRISARMSRVRSKDTKPEMLVRQALWRDGFRYRLHSKDLPGRPDLVFPALGTVVLVHGCFWHGHTCKRGCIPKSNSPFWKEKFDSNRARDSRNRLELNRLGWKVIVVWECSLSSASKRFKTLAGLRRKLSDMKRRRHV